MTTFRMVLASQFVNVLRSRWVVGYTVLLLVITLMLVRFGGSGERALLSLVNVVLVLLPLVSVVFGTLYVYNARAFIEMLLAQPVGRPTLYLALFWALALPMSGALLAGVGLPLGFRVLGEPSLARPLLLLLITGVLLTLVFTAFALCVAVRIDDRARGLAWALLVWLGCTVVYDGLILLVLTTFRDYPLEAATLVLTFANPVDLARVVLLLTFDVAALMGYTGAVFEQAFGTPLGLLAAFGMLLICVAVPLGLGLRWFRHKDF